MSSLAVIRSEVAMLTLSMIIHLCQTDLQCKNCSSFATDLLKDIGC